MVGIFFLMMTLMSFSAEAKYNPVGDCFEGKEIKAKAVEITDHKESFLFNAPSDDKDPLYDVSALAVKMKGMFARNLHKLMVFRNKLESAQLNITFDGTSVSAFTSFSLDEGGGSLQKAIISPSEAKRVTETANVATAGFIMHSTTIRSSGRIVSILSYVNMKDEFPLVFNK